MSGPGCPRDACGVGNLERLHPRPGPCAFASRPNFSPELAQRLEMQVFAPALLVLSVVVPVVRAPGIAPPGRAFSLRGGSVVRVKRAEGGAAFTQAFPFANKSETREPGGHAARRSFCLFFRLPCCFGKESQSSLSPGRCRPPPPTWSFLTLFGSFCCFADARFSARVRVSFGFLGAAAAASAARCAGDFGGFLCSPHTCPGALRCSLCLASFFCFFRSLRALSFATCAAERNNFFGPWS